MWTVKIYCNHWGVLLVDNEISNGWFALYLQLQLSLYLFLVKHVLVQPKKRTFDLTVDTLTCRISLHHSVTLNFTVQTTMRI